MPTTQLVLAWTLSVFLLIWMVTFAVLAIRPRSSKQVSLEDVPTPSMPAISAPTLLHVLVSQPLQSRVRVRNHEPPSDIGATPVA